MNLLRLFKKEKPADAPVANAVVARPVVAKPASERLGKTVMPNAARVMEPDLPMAPAPAPNAPKSFSLGGIAARPLISPRPAPTTSPAGERTVALQLVELLPQIPAELLEGSEIDPAHRVIFNASELERGMANGRPAVSLRSIYQQAPTIFSSEIPAEDKREIPLPFHKVLEQFANLQVREDQEPDVDVPQVETPFLKVTLEDSKKFGTPIPAPRAVAPPPVGPALAPPPVARAEAPVTPPPAPAAVSTPPALKKIAAPIFPPLAPPPTAEATSAPAAAPVPAPAPKISPAPIRLSMPTEKPAAPAPAAATPNEPEQPKAALPVAPKLFPNGAGVPIPERVPASSGSSAPIPLPAPLAPVKPAEPMRIPFKITPPASDLCPPPVLKADPGFTRAPVEFSDGPRLRLSLRSVLAGIPPFQIEGSIANVPEDAKIELPFAIVEPQLALGRVAISPAQFQAAMPEEFRSLYKVDEGGIPVQLPLPEILQNLPNQSLQLRDDQEEVQVAEVFETPFSLKAAEDAARLKVPTGPIAKSAPIAPEPEAVATPPAPAVRSELQETFDTGEPLDAKSIVQHISKLSEIKACAVVFSDGLSLAGNLPPEYEADALCAMAPEIMKRIDTQMASANLGELRALTMFCAKAPVSFFAAGDICLAALHSTADLSAEIRDQLGRATRELAHIYSKPALA